MVVTNGRRWLARQRHESAALHEADGTRWSGEEARGRVIRAHDSPYSIGFCHPAALRRGGGGVRVVALLGDTLHNAAYVMTAVRWESRVGAQRTPTNALYYVTAAPRTFAGL